MLIKMQASSKGKVVAAIKSGKIKTASMMWALVLVFFIIYHLNFGNIRVADFLVYFATIMSIISMIEYF